MTTAHVNWEFNELNKDGYCFAPKYSIPFPISFDFSEIFSSLALFSAYWGLDPPESVSYLQIFNCYYKSTHPIKILIFAIKRGVLNIDMPLFGVLRIFIEYV